MIDGLEIYQPDRWEDFRGDIYTTWDTENYPDLNWRLDKFSHSRKNTLRGLHGDFETWKLINCVYGKFYLVVADNRKDSPTYKPTLALATKVIGEVTNVLPGPSSAAIAAMCSPAEPLDTATAYFDPT